MKLLCGSLRYMTLVFFSFPILAFALTGNNEPLGKKHSVVCGFVGKSSMRHFFVAPNGMIVAPEINAGDIPENDAELVADDVQFRTSYRLLVSGLGAILVTSPDLKFVAIKPTCPGTSEFMIKYTISTKSARAGRITETPNYVIEGPGEYDRFEGRVKLNANILMPRIELDDSLNHSSDAKDFFQGKRSHLEIAIRNTGSAPLTIDGVVKKGGGTWYSIDFHGCTVPSVAPGTGCSIVLRRTSEYVENREARDTLSIRSNYKLGYPVIAIDWSHNNFEIRFSNE
jgi:hypothetical protein